MRRTPVKRHAKRSLIGKSFDSWSMGGRNVVPRISDETSFVTFLHSLQSIQYLIRKAFIFPNKLDEYNDSSDDSQPQKI